MNKPESIVRSRELYTRISSDYKEHEEVIGYITCLLNLPFYSDKKLYSGYELRKISALLNFAVMKLATNEEKSGAKTPDYKLPDALCQLCKKGVEKDAFFTLGIAN